MGPRLFSRGKSGSADELPCGQSGFNGAAAFQPRKEEAYEEDERPAAPASMGPRLFSRGKKQNGQQQGNGQASFNGAAAFQPRKGSPRRGARWRPDWLQW